MSGEKILDPVPEGGVRGFVLRCGLRIFRAGRGCRFLLRQTGCFHHEFYIGTHAVRTARVRGVTLRASFQRLQHVLQRGGVGGARKLGQLSDGLAGIGVQPVLQLCRAVVQAPRASTISSGLPGANATAARDFISRSSSIW